MSSTSLARPTNSQVAMNRLLWVGPLVILAGVVANTIVQWIAVSILQPDPAFVPLAGSAPAVFTFFGLVGAVVAFAIIGRLSQDPIPLFRRVALIALALSFIPDLLLLVLGFIPAATPGGVLALALMHVVAWAIAVYGLTRFART